MFNEREVALAIECLRRRLQAAEDAGESRALIRALRETLTEFEAGLMPHRYSSQSSITYKDGADPESFVKGPGSELLRSNNRPP